MGVMKRLATMGRGGGGGGGGRRGRSLMECDWFFDRKSVTNAVDGATRRVLSRFGAFVRTTSRRSIRRPRRKRLDEMTRMEEARYRATGRKPTAPSDPGRPPRNQWGLLKGHIYFWYLARHRSVTIGPAKLPGMRGDVPGVLEHGGTSIGRHGRPVRIQARPYMGPALAKELPRLDDLWRNSVRSRV